jgi:choline monooxygenase
MPARAPSPPQLQVDADIRSARTLPSELYCDAVVYQRLVDRVLARTWHVLGDGLQLPGVGEATPVTLLPGSLDEPLLLTRDATEAVHLLSNVCTHRGNLLVSEPCRAQTLRCRYHGRRFSLDGRFAFMPEFEGALAFPSPSDDLPRVPRAAWGPVHLASLDPAFSFESAVAPIHERVGWLLERPHVFDAATSRDYLVGAHWALYCDNYLEGFHIPFVHAGLAEALDYGAYSTELFPLGSLQIGVAKEGEPAFDLPPGHPDAGRRVAAYYVWLFPATMLNLYPWGLSLNAVRPLGTDRTCVSFQSFVADPARRAEGAGADLHRVELEDERVVEAVQRGVRSRLYRNGRLSPARERGVHHFHRLLAAHLA